MVVSEVWRGGEEEEIAQEKHMHELRCTLCDYAYIFCHARVDISTILRVIAEIRCSIDRSHTKKRRTHHTKTPYPMLKPAHPSDPTTAASSAPS